MKQKLVMLFSMLSLTAVLVVNEAKSAQTLLVSLSTVQIPSTGQFVAKKYFTADSKEVNIAWLGDNFRQHFISKVEEPQAEVELRISRLKKASLDAPILAELGSKAETSLANIWQMLKKQPNGESGKLLTNGYMNIFYVRDAKGVLRAVDVHWSSDGWHVRAYSVTYPIEWSEGYQVFSRNF